MRKPGKKKVGVWLSDEEKAVLKKIAKQNGCTGVSDLLKKLIENGGKLGLLILCAFHLFKSPSDWGFSALLKSGRELVALARTAVK